MSVQITPAIKKMIQDGAVENVQARMARMAKLNRDSSEKAAAMYIFKRTLEMRAGFFGSRDLTGFAVTDITVDFVREKYLADLSDEEINGME